MAMEEVLQKIAGVAGFQGIGKRSNMEDRYVVVERPGVGLFMGLFDGHGGVQVADFLAERMPPAFFESLNRCPSPQESFVECFARLEEECSGEDIGSTAICAFISGTNLIMANCGDSQGLVIGPGFRVECLTRPHRLTDKTERARILAGGGRITDPYYFKSNKGMIPTRSFGDTTMREVGLIARPQFTQRALLADDLYAILASDGLFDVLKPEDIAEVLKSKPTAKDAPIRLVGKAIEKGVSDNVTVVVVEFK